MLVLKLLRSKDPHVRHQSSDHQGRGEDVEILRLARESDGTNRFGYWDKCYNI